MEGQTSNANAGSKRDLNNYKKLETQNVSNKTVNKLLNKKGLYSFDVNAISCSFGSDIIINGQRDEITEVNSYATLLFNLDNMKDFVSISVRNINPENAEKIEARRSKEAAKKAKAREEREAREAEEAKARETDENEKGRSEIVMTRNSKQIERTDYSSQDKDVV